MLLKVALNTIKQTSKQTDILNIIFKGGLNKWLYTPAGCAMLYIKKEHQSWVQPLVTAESYMPSIQSEFFWQGSRTCSPYCVIPEAIKFHNDIGGCVSNLLIST